MRTVGEQSSPNQISRAHRGPQRLKWQSWCLQRSELGPGHICHSCAACCSYGTPNSRSRAVSDFSLALGTTFLLLGCLTYPCYEGLCQVYCILLCHVLLISLRVLLFFEGKLQRSGLWGGVKGEIGRSGGRKNCGQDILRTKD